MYKRQELERNLNENVGLIDVVLQCQIENEKQKWREILKRLLYCLKYLAVQNLALRGHRELLRDDDDDSTDTNMGNFIGLLKLLAVFDPIMKEHLIYVQNNPGSTSYISPAIQNEFLHLMASAVRKNLLNKIRKAKYYGLMFDSTPDHAHREQMSQVVRYVEIDFQNKTVHIRESFLGFIQISQKNAEGLVEVMLSQLEKDDMKLQDCRSQCYDNANVMAGHITGVRQRILEKNNLAMFVNCDNHSLNLVGVRASKQETMMVTFFGTLDFLYAFFSRSTQRWEQLKNAVPLVVKSDSETRWSAKAHAVKPVSKYVDKIILVLQNLASDESKTTDTRSDAEQLCKRVLTFEFLSLIRFWDLILSKIDRIQQRLQHPEMNFHSAALDLKSLWIFFQKERDGVVNTSIDEGVTLCQDWDVEMEKRRPKKKTNAWRTM